MSDYSRYDDPPRRDQDRPPMRSRYADDDDEDLRARATPSVRSYSGDTDRISSQSTPASGRDRSPPPARRESSLRYSSTDLPPRPQSPPRGFNSRAPQYESTTPAQSAYDTRRRALSPPRSSIGRGEDDRSLALATPRRAAPSEAGTLTDNLQKLKLTSFYVRPGFGKEGKAIDVLSNFFAVRAKGGRGKIIHHYDVEINPVVHVQNQKKPKAMLRAVWEQTCLDATGNWVDGFSACAYDGRKNCFTPIMFPIAKGEVKSFITTIAPDNVVQRPATDGSGSDSENRRFKVEIKHVAEIDLERVMEHCKPDRGTPKEEEDMLTGIMATNVLMRDLPSKRYAQVGATGNRFFTLKGAVPIPHGAVVCKGFMQSFRASGSGLPLLNLDVGFSAFLASGPALEVIGKMIAQRGGVRGGPRGMGAPRGGFGGPPGQHGVVNELEARDISMIKNKLRGAKFTVTHRQSTRLHTIQSITLQSAEEITFVMDSKDGSGDKKISIVQYFRQLYNVEVSKPRLPCVQYGKKNFVPLEFVNLADWNPLPPTKLSADQTAEMIKVAAMPPKERSMAIMGWRKELAHETQSKIADWGLQVNSAMVQVKARILPPPRVLYGRGMEARAAHGGWNLRGKTFYRNGKAPLKAWSIISFDRYTDDDEMKRYVTYLIEVLRAHGVMVENARPKCIGPIDPRQPESIKAALQLAAREAYMAGKCSPQLICAVLPGRDAWLYEEIKRCSFLELKGPVPTQCMQSAKIRNPRGIDAYTGNLVMKIQSKLGGLTHQIPITELPGMERGKTMLLGADLGHPPVKAGYSDAPTVACSIATYTADCDAYSAQIRLQEGREEIIKELSGMVLAHLKIFAKKNDGELPDRIIVFRDGISEGQYAACLQYEHNAILRACTSLKEGYRPRILICVCAKRHNTRFFGKDLMVDRSGNLPPGLVVDQAVTHPYAFDFYMQAHAGRVGTARPTHYICLVDELGLTPDMLQKMVHSMCYAFARCTKSVSLVPVCYIADLVCQKARIVVHEPGTTTAPSESSFGRGQPVSRGGGRGGYAASRAGSGGGHSDRTGTTALKARNAGVDVMQIQKVLEKNPELADVGWWM